MKNVSILLCFKLLINCFLLIAVSQLFQEMTVCSNENKQNQCAFKAVYDCTRMTH